MSGGPGSFDEEKGKRRRRIASRWRIAAALAGLAAGISLFGGLVLPNLRSNLPPAQVEPQDVVFSIETNAPRGCPHRPSWGPRL